MIQIFILVLFFGSGSGGRTFINPVGEFEGIALCMKAGNMIRVVEKYARFTCVAKNSIPVKEPK